MIRPAVRYALRRLLLVLLGLFRCLVRCLLGSVLGSRLPGSLFLDFRQLGLELVHGVLEMSDTSNLSYHLVRKFGRGGRFFGGG